MDILQVVFDWVNRVSQAIIGLSIIAGALIIRPWQHIAGWRASQDERRSFRRYQPPVTRAEKFERARSARVGLALRRQPDKWFGVDIHNDGEYGTAFDVRLYLDDIPDRAYPTRVGRSRHIRRLKPGGCVVRWFKYDPDQQPATVKVTWTNKDGTEGCRCMENTLKNS